MRKFNYKPSMPSFDSGRVRKSAKKNSSTLKLAAVILAGFLAGVLGGIVGYNIQDDDSFSSQSTGQTVVSSESELITSLAENAGPSVVSINVLGPETRGLFGDIQRQSGAGTGFIVDESGIIATNRHVVGGEGSTVTVTLSDGTELDDVEIIGATPDGDPLDIAFLKVNNTEGKEMTPLPLGDSGEVQVGQKVAAIGNALGQFQNTVTTGIISGYGRDIQAMSESGFGTDTLQNLFQTDAAINAGNSGGPLVNMNGEVIGVNTAVAGGGAENIGFAIPINDLKGLISSVMETGELKRPYLGVRYMNLTADYAYEYNLDVDRGAYILPGVRGQSGGVLPDSPAAKAGLKEKDVITHVEGNPVNERNSLISLISQHQVGETVTLTVVRNGQERKIDVKLEAIE